MSTKWHSPKGSSSISSEAHPLRPDAFHRGQAEPLKVKPDGRIMDRNTRIKVLEERGYDINSLPREAVE